MSARRSERTSCTTSQKFRGRFHPPPSAKCMRSTSLNISTTSSRPWRRSIASARRARGCASRCRISRPATPSPIRRIGISSAISALIISTPITGLPFTAGRGSSAGRCSSCSPRRSRTRSCIDSRIAVPLRTSSGGRGSFRPGFSPSIWKRSSDTTDRHGVIKQWAFTWLPRPATAISASRGRRRSHRFVRQWGLHDLNKRLLAERGNRVIGGPFAGLVLTDLSHCEHIGPYLLGTYEMELHAIWAGVLKRPFGQIVDVGASFGYYAVGLARRFPAVPVIAFDTDWWARRAVRQMAAANRTPNVSVKGFCDPAWMASHLKHNALIVVDCEGHEGRLLCERPLPAFSTATLVIELHEEFVPGVTARIRAAFERTHSCAEINSRD